MPGLQSNDSDDYQSSFPHHCVGFLVFRSGSRRVLLLLFLSPSIVTHNIVLSLSHTPHSHNTVTQLCADGRLSWVGWAPRLHGKHGISSSYGLIGFARICLCLGGAEFLRFVGWLHGVDHWALCEHYALSISHSFSTFMFCRFVALML